MHYTWGPQFKRGDTLVWEFDKRKYTEPKHEKEVRGGLPCLPAPFWLALRACSRGLPHVGPALRAHPRE